MGGRWLLLALSAASLAALPAPACADESLSGRVRVAIERFVRERADALVTSVDVPELRAFESQPVHWLLSTHHRYP